MKKISVFSKKLNRPMELQVAREGSAWISESWNNDAWIDQGWRQAWNNGCYVSTACTQYKGLPDDCYELQTLRYFRDAYCKNDESLREKVLKYYKNAPIIAKKLNECENRDERLGHLYDELVVKCVKLFEENKVEEGFKLYFDVYSDLEKEFLS